MRTTELRVGNWVEQSGSHYQLDENSLIDMMEYWRVFGKILHNPVPLTKEWLLKLGSKKTHSKSLWLPLFNLKAELHFEIFEKEIVCMILSDYCKLILDPIKYVHQLQNLYFALTENEL